MSQTDLQLLEELQERVHWDPKAENEIKALQRKMGYIWTHYHDLHTGGGLKTDYTDIFINAPEDEAKILFKKRFGIDPEGRSCDCGTCGPDFNIVEGTLDEITCYERKCNSIDGKWVDAADPKRPGYISIEQYKKSPDILFIEEKRRNPLRRKRRKFARKQRGCKHSNQCAVCKKIIEFVICRRKRCFIKGRHYAMWETTPEKWRKLPAKYRKKILCKKCFKKLAGISAGPQWWGY